MLAAAREKASFEIEEVDIDQHPEWLALYHEEVPVIAIDGRKAFKYRVDLQEFLRKLAARR
jgi:hypothetical protein